MGHLEQVPFVLCKGTGLRDALSGRCGQLCYNAWVVKASGRSTQSLASPSDQQPQGARQPPCTIHQFTAENLG